ncbi:ribonuclease HIII [Mycoplasmatota bacterium]|nr:ribonuclease HIII [Mycoplasmatota bacterium]
MKHYTLSVTTEELQQLHKTYQNHCITTDNPYLLFHAKHHETNIFGYNTGKLVLQGKEITHEIVLIKKIINREDYEAIGSDEVGTGDVFGPIVVCAAFASKTDIPLLEQLGVRDSKNISDKKIIEIGPKLAKLLVHSLIILSPQKYNKLIAKGYNLNKIKALLHNQAIVKTFEKVGHQVPIILDQFCAPNLYFNYLKDETEIYRDIEFHTKAEQVHLSVAAASIISRYAFLVKLDQYSKKIDVKLLKGASKEVDSQILNIYNKVGLKQMPTIAKMNFKNITKQNLF